MNGQGKTGEVGEVLSRTRRKMKEWGIPVSYLARQMGVSRQYAWQAINQRTVVSEERAWEFHRSVDAIVSGRRHLSTFGDRLRAARVAAGLTLKQVAALIGYSWVGVERWERDVCLPKPGVIWHLLSLYGVSPPEYGMTPAAGSPSSARGNSGRLDSRGVFGAREDLALSLRTTTGKFTSAAQRVHRPTVRGMEPDPL